MLFYILLKLNSKACETLIWVNHDLLFVAINKSWTYTVTSIMSSSLFMNKQGSYCEGFKLSFSSLVVNFWYHFNLDWRSPYNAFSILHTGFLHVFDAFSCILLQLLSLAVILFWMNQLLYLHLYLAKFPANVLESP